MLIIIVVNSSMRVSVCAFVGRKDSTIALIIYMGTSFDHKEYTHVCARQQNT